jgi:hypothetical protein
MARVRLLTAVQIFSSLPPRPDGMFLPEAKWPEDEVNHSFQNRRHYVCVQITSIILTYYHSTKNQRLFLLEIENVPIKGRSATRQSKHPPSFPKKEP